MDSHGLAEALGAWGGALALLVIGGAGFAILGGLGELWVWAATARRRRLLRLKVQQRGPYCPRCTTWHPESRHLARKNPRNRGMPL